MNLAAKYNRTELIRDGEIQAWKGIDRSTGEAVVLYLYTGEVSGGQPLSEVARGPLAQALGTGETQVEGGVFGLSPCMVARAAQAGIAATPATRTPAPPVFSAPPPQQAPVAAPTPAPAATSDGAHGEFTAMFGAALAENAVAPSASVSPSPQPAPAFSAPPPQTPTPAAPEPEQAPAAESMGEFTRMFRAADVAKGLESAAPEATPPAAPSVSDTPAAPPHPGVFTSLYMAANTEAAPAAEAKAEPPAAAAPATPAAPPQPGVFTNLYMAVSPAAMPEGTSGQTAPESKAPEASAEPAIGEFTSLFMAAKQPEAAAPAPSVSAPAVENATPAFAVPEVAAQAPSAPDDAPGEFTMAFRSASLPASSPDAKLADEPRASAPEPPRQELPPAEVSFDETAELTLGDRPAAVAPTPEVPLSEATMMTPVGEDIGVGDGPGEFTRLFQAAPEDETPGWSEEKAAESAIATPTIAEVKPEADEAALRAATPEESATASEGAEEAERYSSASPAKGPIRFVASEKAASEETSKPARSPLQSGSFSQTYVSTGEMPVMREPILGVPAPAVPASQASQTPPMETDAPGEFTMLFASPGGAATPPAPDPAPLTPPPTPVTPAPATPEAAPMQPAAAAPVAPADAPKPAAEGQGPGEFTKFFQPGDVDKMKQEMAAMAKPDSPAASQAKPAEEAPMGEFTRMFSAAEIASRVEKPKDPGVFTSLYMAADANKQEMATPSAPVAPPAFSAPAPAPADAGGSFTSMFRAAEAGSAPGTSASASTSAFMPVAPSGGLSSPQVSSGGEEPSFTRYFQASDLPAAPAAPQQPEVVAPSPDLPAYSSEYSKGATSFFQAVPEPSAPAAPVQQGPGEYTRMISGDEVKQAMAAPGMQPGAAPAGGGAGGGVSVPIGVPMTAPSVSGPYVQGPHMSGPQMSGPQISSSGISGPQFQGPHMSGPQMSAPQVHGPQMGTPQLQTPHMQVQVPPMQAGGAPPVAPGQQAPVAGGASKIIIIATVLVTVIAVVLVLMVAYFMLKG